MIYDSLMIRRLKSNLKGGRNKKMSHIFQRIIFYFIKYIIQAVVPFLSLEACNLLMMDRVSKNMLCAGSS